MKRLALLAASGLVSMLPSIASARPHFFFFGPPIPVPVIAPPVFVPPPVVVVAPPVFAPAVVEPAPVVCDPAPVVCVLRGRGGGRVSALVLRAAA